MNSMCDIGLILEGGGMRGIYTAGVLDFFLDQDLEFKNCYGVSAGSCHACSYISRQRGRAYAISVDYLDDPRYCSLKSLIQTGDMFGADMCYHLIPDELNPYDYDTVDKYDGTFYAVVTNITTGKAEYIPIKDSRKDIIAIQASSSLPLLSRNVKIGDNEYLDGGIADSIPIRKSIQDGHKKNVLILTRDPSYRKSPNKLLPILDRKYKEYPNLVKQMARRHIHYNNTLDFIEKEKEAGHAFVIQPKEPVKIRRIEKDKEKLKSLYETGYQDAANCYEDLKKFLELS